MLFALIINIVNSKDNMNKIHNILNTAHNADIKYDIYIIDYICSVNIIIDNWVII